MDYIKRLDHRSSLRPKRGVVESKVPGVMMMTLYGSWFQPAPMITLLFTNKGRVYRPKGYEILNTVDGQGIAGCQSFEAG